MWVSLTCYFLSICSDSQVINSYRISWKNLASLIPATTQSINLYNNFQMELNKGWLCLKINLDLEIKTHTETNK